MGLGGFDGEVEGDATTLELTGLGGVAGPKVTAFPEGFTGTKTLPSPDPVLEFSTAV